MRLFSFLTIIIFILLTSTGCTNKNELKETDTVTDKTFLSNESITPTVAASSTKEPTVKLTDGMINLNLDEYQLCGLTINSTESQIIDVLGKPKYPLDYYVYGSNAWSELRCLMEYDGIKIRTSKQLKMNVDEEDGDYLLSVIDVYKPDYTTHSGIQVGDSMEDVKNAYNDIPIFTFDTLDTSLEGNMIYHMLTRKDRPKVNGDDGYEVDFDYGYFESFAYIYYFDEENPSLRTSLTFLFQNDIVTHIILYNWLYEVV